MKKIIMVIMVLMVMIFNLAGCGNESSNQKVGCGDSYNWVNNDDWEEVEDFWDEAYFDEDALLHSVHQDVKAYVSKYSLEHGEVISVQKIGLYDCERGEVIPGLEIEYTDGSQVYVKFYVEERRAGMFFVKE